MAKEILVGSTLTKEMIELGKAVVDKVTISSLEVVGAFWLYFDEAEEWRLALVSRRLNRDGPLALYREFSKLFFGEDRDPEFGFSLLNTTFLDPSDKLVRALASIPSRADLHDVMLPGFLSYGTYVPDTYVYFMSDEIKPFNGHH